MYAYPKGEELGYEDRRVEAVKKMAENLDWMVQALRSHSKNSEEISRQDVERIAQEAGATKCLRFIGFERVAMGKYEVEIADVGGIIDVFDEAWRRAERLRRIVDTPGSDTKEILGGDAERVRPESSVASATRKLKELREEMPVFLSVRKRYKPRERDRPDPSQPMPMGVYWTDRTDPMESTNHALLLTGYKKGIVSYKDPNFGDIEIRITVEQFMEMAGDRYLTMRPYDPDRGALDELGD
ncbi:hypothetical protein ACWF94_06650 [Streptomyces sp. NPDC055078]